MPALEFKGKQFVYAHHLSVPFRPLVIDEDKSLPSKGKGPSLNDNLIIHGDNLHALKALLPVYAGKVGVICIDPPYNMGGDWCYDDKVNSPLMREWLKDYANPVDKDDLERHDKWLCMMWPRLKLMKELLSPDGLIAVTIDDNELFHLGMLLDDVFGQDHILACAPWLSEPSGGKEKTGLRGGHEFVLIYHNGDPSAITQDEKEIGALNVEDKRGPYRKGRELRKWGGTSLRKDRPGQWYPLPAPDGTEAYPIRNDGEEGHWRWGENNRKIHQAKADPDFFHWEKRPFDPGVTHEGQKERWVPHEKIRTTSKALAWGTWLDSHGFNSDATRELKEIFGYKAFDTPKPTALFKWIVSLHGDDDAIVLDSFPGSGTTAHAVLALNAEDGGTRKFILIEREDYVDSITAERVRRLVNGYSFEGTKKETLYSHELTYTSFKKAVGIFKAVKDVETSERHRFDKITKKVEEGVLTVTGEKKITEKVEGLKGSFTFCALGPEISIEGLLTGEKLPDYEALASYVFYTATGQTLSKVSKRKSDWFIGETENYRVHLIYQPNKDWLRSNEAVLDAATVDRIAETLDRSHKALVFSPAKFMGQKELTARHIEFCQLPYAIYRILGD
jgi:adenine-specific DNA-methyltransferase